MSYLIFTKEVQQTYPFILLTNHLQLNEIEQAFEPIKKDLMCLSIAQNTTSKVSVTSLREHFESEILPVLKGFHTQYLLVTDAKYFKALVKVAKVSETIGYIYDSTLTTAKIVYCPSPDQIFFNPVEVRAKITTAINTVVDHFNGTYDEPGTGIIREAKYPKTLGEIKLALDSLLDRDLTIDIETFSLKHYSSGIGSITLCDSKHTGIAFLVDSSATERNEPVRKLLREFFENYTKTAVYHNASFDIYILVYQLFMSSLLDTAGLLYGLEVMTKNFHCTKILTYLAVNSCSRNSLSLKDQAVEFAGNWGMGDDIKDITLIPPDKLLEYNLTDGLATWFVMEKNWGTVIADNQLEIYNTLFKPAIVDVIQMQLTGMPIDMKRVAEVKQELAAISYEAVRNLYHNPIVCEFTHLLNDDWVAKRNTELKVKRVTLADANEVFNFNSVTQLQKLLYSFLGLPVVSYTDAKQPSTDSNTLTALKAHTTNTDVLAVLTALLDIKGVDKILGTFMPALETAVLAEDGWHYLFGSLNLGATVSGRLSSSSPNLQTIPSGSHYGKLVKSCFKAPPGWLFVGLDFESLEDKISALTTKDPNKLRLYTEGYDGHCLRAYAYADGTEPWYQQVRQASLEETTYKVTIDGKVHYLKGTDEILDSHDNVITLESFFLGSVL